MSGSTALHRAGWRWCGVNGIGSWRRLCLSRVARSCQFLPTLPARLPPLLSSQAQQPCALQHPLIRGDL